ncbi:MAG: T9SS type A sorting domain-containing protein [Bacteroidia bacterium]|nr:T9SS type A sorting domain-containing protein [Bacteroidia bacterium]
MKKISTFICFLSAFLSFSFAQNLVLNPGFENINVNCSGFAGAGYTNIVDWYNPDPTDTCSTPDWFSTCLNGFFPTAAPNSWLGSQSPRTGDAYGGFIAYEATSNSYREYLEGTLSSPLVQGQTYCVSFYISLADTVPFAVDKIGVYFSNTFVQFPVSHCISTVPLPVTPQLQWAGGVADDVVNWVRMDWQYVASGGEQYFVIGNFFNNAATTIQNTGASGFTTPFAYYFVDDVSVTPGICCDAGILSAGSFCTGGTPASLVANTSGGTWSGTGITNPSSGTFDPVVAGQGSHIITYTLPCGAFDTISIQVNNCMEACIDTSGSISVNGGTGPYTWQSQTITQDCSGCLIGCTFPPGCAVNVVGWQNFATGNSITPPAAYPVQVVDNNGQNLVINSISGLPACPSGCQMTANVVSTDILCFGDKTGTAIATAGNGTPPYAYSWNTGQINDSIINLNVGTYTCYILDASGCTTIVSTTVNQPPSIGLSGSSTPNTGGGNGTATVIASGGTPPFTYTWNTNPPQYTSTATGLIAGSYTCIITDANGCFRPFTISVTEALDVEESVAGIQHMSISPNPSNGTFSVKITLINPSELTLSVYDITGKLISENQKQVVYDYTHTFRLNEISNGFYTLKIKTRSGEIIRKILIQ